MTDLFALDETPWERVDDDVMGGRSRSAMVRTEQGLRFEGTLSTANGGGFASMRRNLGVDLTGAAGLRLTVCGDGRRYQLRLRANADPQSLAYRYVFPTGDTWQTITLPLRDFEPVFRGRSVPDAEPFRPGAMRFVSLMTADPTPGPFRLDIARSEVVAAVVTGG